jgi:hypothetical protein
VFFCGAGGLGADVSGFCFLKNSHPGSEFSRQGEEKFFCHSQKNFRFFFEAIRAEIVYAREALCFLAWQRARVFDDNRASDKQAG